MTDICFDRAAPNPVALVLLDWTADRNGAPAKGTTVAHLDANGTLYGCRDITAGQHHDDILSAWCATSRVPIEDRRRYVDACG